MVMFAEQFIDVYIEGGNKNPLKMTRTRYSHPTLDKGHYIRLYEKGGAPDKESGLLFNGKDELIGLWTVKRIVF